MQVLSGNDKLRSYDAWLNAVLLALTIGAAATGYATIIYPAQAQVVTVQEQSAELEALVQKGPTITRAHRAFKEQLAKTTQDADQLEKRIPSAPRESDFLAQICQLAERVGMEVVDYQSGATQSFENHREMEVKLNTRAEYAAFCQFLEQVDQVPRLCRLINLEIAPEPTGANLSIVLTFRIYFSPPAEKTPANEGQS